MAQPDRTLTLRAVLLVLGAFLGALGMSTEKDWLVYTAIGVIGAGGVLAIIRRMKRD